MPALKYSRQREAIKNFLMTRRDHPTADVVYHSLRTEFPNISLGTVYRNLTLLADLGEIPGSGSGMALITSMPIQAAIIILSAADVIPYRILTLNSRTHSICFTGLTDTATGSKGTSHIFMEPAAAAAMLLPADCKPNLRSSHRTGEDF